MNVYIKNRDQYFRYYKIALKKSGLYIIDNSKKGDHFSYHTDGTCFHHSLGKRLHKKIRKPLNEFEGIESLSCVNVSIFFLPDKDSKKPDINPDDFIIDRKAPFCFELILSNMPFELPNLAERANSEYWQRKIGNLYLTIEVFENTTEHLATMRYNPNNWIPGSNFFVWMDGKWQ
jgi:hypothetical protein